MNAIINANFNGFNVSFRNDGYLNATAIAKMFGKQPRDYIKTEQTQEYLTELAAHLTTKTKILVNKNQLVAVKNGGNERGTWLHPKLAIHFARWLDSKFAVWCDEQIEKILGSTPSDKINEYEKQQIKDAVNKRHRRTEETHQAIYTKLHQFIGVNSYHEIPANRFQDALQFIGSTADTPSKPSNHITVHLPAGNNRWLVTVDSKGHQVMQADSLLENSLTVTEQEVQDIAVSACNMQRMSLVYEHLHPALSILKSRFSVQAEAFSTDYFSHSIALTRIVNRLRPQLSAQSQYEIGSTMSGML